MTSSKTPQRLVLLATACLLGVALPGGSAYAQETKTKTKPPSAQAMQSDVAVTIPDIEAVDSNVDDETLRAIFSGDLENNAEALAGLTATSITIPEITVAMTTEIEGESTEASFTFSDLVLTDVTEGVAAEISLASTTGNMGEDVTFESGTLSAANFDIGGVLGFYGAVDNGDDATLRTIYTDLSYDGGSFQSPELSCTFGAVQLGEASARPLNFTGTEFVALFNEMESQGEELSPELTGRLMRMYADLLTAFESSPSTMEGYECSGTDGGEDVSFSIDKIAVGGFTPGIYPSIDVDGMSVSVEDDGVLSVGNMSFAETDLSGPIAAIQSAPEAIDEAWFAENARSLIPEFAGFSLADIDLDFPDIENPETRIKASVAGFELALSDYLNGIPTGFLLKASNIVADLPTNTADPQIAQLIALGVTSIDAGFTLASTWNEAENTISIDEVSFTGADLATIVLTGTIINATEQLFGLNEDDALLAAMGLAISNLKLDVTDEGLTDIIIASVAADQGADPATLRPVFAGLAEGTVVGLLAGAADAQKVSIAISAFVRGTAKYLSIEMTAKDEAGIGLNEFIAAETDPSALIGKVDIEASAK